MTRASLLAVLAACRIESTTAIDLELLPNPELNSQGDLAARIQTLVIVVDAATGQLYPLDAERDDGDIKVKNADSDPSDLELVALVPMPSGRLPRIRIERGGLPDVPLHIRVLGNVQGEAGVEMARGGVTNVSFVDGEITNVPTPFNLLPRWLPLRVTEVAPADGQTVPCGSHLDILTVFSRSIDPASVKVPGRISVEELGVGGVEPADLLVTLNTATFVPSRMITAYRLTLSSEIVDTDGTPLDQLPAMGGLQPYDAEFRLQCSGAMAPIDNWCRPKNPTAPCPGPNGRFRCESGQCVPNSCTGASCTPSFVCNPTTLACEPDDCQLYGDC